MFFSRLKIKILKGYLECYNIYNSLNRSNTRSFIKQNALFTYFCLVFLRSLLVGFLILDIIRNIVVVNYNLFYFLALAYSISFPLTIIYHKFAFSTMRSTLQKSRVIKVPIIARTVLVVVIFFFYMMLKSSIE